MPSGQRRVVPAHDSRLYARTRKAAIRYHEQRRCLEFDADRNPGPHEKASLEDQLDRLTIGKLLDGTVGITIEQNTSEGGGSISVTEALRLAKPHENCTAL